jgi:hypothetical protein
MVLLEQVQHLEQLLLVVQVVLVAVVDLVVLLVQPIQVVAVEHKTLAVEQVGLTALLVHLFSVVVEAEAVALFLVLVVQAVVVRVLLEVQEVTV